MLRAVGSVEAAATALRLAREKHLGNPLAGVLDSSYGEGLEDDHRDYLRDTAANGVPAALLRGPGDPRLARQRGAAGLGERGSAIIL